MTITRTRFGRLAAGLLALGLVLAACGSDDDAAADETTTTEAAETTTTAEAEAPSDDGAAADGLPVELGEWFITLPDGLAAGSLTFTSENAGEFPHALAVARGTTYEDLPQKENGAVDTDALGADFIGTTENIEPGATGSITFDLEAGDYVFFCPIEFGPNSHAANGQVLSVTIG